MRYPSGGSDSGDILMGKRKNHVGKGLVTNLIKGDWLTEEEYEELKALLEGGKIEK